MHIGSNKLGLPDEAAAFGGAGIGPLRGTIGLCWRLETLVAWESYVGTSEAKAYRHGFLKSEARSRGALIAATVNFVRNFVTIHAMQQAVLFGGSIVFSFRIIREHMFVNGL
ncbi:hypothetical protein MKZ02_21095 [Pseudobacillus sp. FSL P4-0506]|uniref:hypothetical protein n=1 Tax=Pseudobacillus sp. FSL P4-0506 TaxID=2921576 RepID=UPI0030FC1C16